MRETCSLRYKKEASRDAQGKQRINTTQSTENQTTLYVQNIPCRWGSEDIRAHFAAFGPIASCDTPASIQFAESKNDLSVGNRA